MHVGIFLRGVRNYVNRGMSVLKENTERHVHKQICGGGGGSREGEYVSRYVDKQEGHTVVR